VPVWAAGELQQMGPVTAREGQMAALSLVTVLVWVLGGAVLEPTTVALIAIALMLLLGIVSWDDVTGNRMGWSTLVLLATLVALADGMNKVGFVAWLARAAAQALSGLPALVVMGGLVALFFLVHYFFASLTAHTTAVLPVLLAAGLAVPGMPIRPFVMLACYSLGMMGVITPYATGPAPVYYATGYISRRAFWSLGLFFGLFFLAVLLGIGAPYLMTLYP
ncbi:MAG TPA: SLC13 family permease, partial [Vicinamibacteria bacterium]|nr:SLC13 family permease [Vicinamibacteria bacterium]